MLVKAGEAGVLRLESNAGFLVRPIAGSVLTCCGHAVGESSEPSEVINGAAAGLISATLLWHHIPPPVGPGDASGSWGSTDSGGARHGCGSTAEDRFPPLVVLSIWKQHLLKMGKGF